MPGVVGLEQEHGQRAGCAERKADVPRGKASGSDVVAVSKCPPRIVIMRCLSKVWLAARNWSFSARDDIRLDLLQPCNAVVVGHYLEYIRVHLCRLKPASIGPRSAPG